MRRLAVTALSMAAAVFAANYILPLWVVLTMCVLCLAAALLIENRFLLPRIIVLALFAASFGFALFTGHYFLTGHRAKALAGTEHELNCVVLDYPIVYEDYCRVDVRLDTKGLPKFKAIVYDNSKASENAEPGDIISLKGRLSPADTRYGEGYDYYNSIGIYLLVSGRSEATVRDGGFRLSVLPVKINHALASVITRIFPEDTAAFMKSLMLGDKTELYRQGENHLALSHAGLMHIVAVSGMHIAFMLSLVRTVFGYGRKSSMCALAVMWIFVFVSGMSPSAVRAGIMQTFVLLAPALRRENDPITSLSAALALILIFNPNAAASVSLQLSFAATAGILILSPIFIRGLANVLPEIVSRRFSGLIQIVASSAAGMVFTTPLVALHFGYITLLSILSNILALPVVSLCFCGGYIACLLSLVPSLGVIAGAAVSILARYILLVAGFVSKLPFAVVYLESFWISIWIALTYLLFSFCAFRGRGLMYRLVLPLALSVFSLVAATAALRLSYSMGSGVITALDVGQGQCITVFSGENTVMLDCGSTGSLDNAGEKAAAYLHTCGRKKLDVLILSHLHSDHANGLERLAQRVDIGAIILPYNYSGEDVEEEVLLQTAEKYGIELLYVDEDRYFDLGNIHVELYSGSDSGDVNERCLMSRVSVGDYDMLVCSDSDKDSEKELCSRYSFSDTELLIVGHHGSRNAASGQLLSALGGEDAIISVGYNSYGHPTHEVLERLEAYGYNVYRTDLNGNIEIRIR